MTYLYEVGTSIPRDHGAPGRVIDRKDHPRLGPRYLVAWPDRGGLSKTWVNEATVTKALIRESKRAQA